MGTAVMDMSLLILTGMPGAGKEEFVSMAKEAGFEVVRMGDVVRRECDKRLLGNTDASVGGLANNEREVHGDDVWARRTMTYIGESDTLIDGCRSLAEVNAFRLEYGDDAIIIAIHTRPEARYQRLQCRGRSDAPGTWEQFEERDLRELGWGLGEVIARANVMLVNEGTLRDFQSLCQNALGELRE